MKIDTFLTLYKNKKNENDRVEFIESHVEDKYVPIEEKQARAQSIIKSSYYQKNKDGSESFHVNSVAKYMLSCMTLLDLYTDIERSNKEGKILDEFNKLNEIGIFDLIIQMINPKEIKEFNMILDMESSDIMTNEYELEGFIRNQVERFGNLIGATLLPVLNNLDVGQIEDVVKKYIK